MKRIYFKIIVLMAVFAVATQMQAGRPKTAHAKHEKGSLVTPAEQDIMLAAVASTDQPLENYSLESSLNNLSVEKVAVLSAQLENTLKNLHYSESLLWRS